MIFKFDANKNKLYEFLDNCTKALKLIKTGLKDVLLTIIETKLTDNARALIRNREFNNWETLKNHLLGAYSQKRTGSMATRIKFIETKCQRRCNIFFQLN